MRTVAWPMPIGPGWLPEQIPWLPGIPTTCGRHMSFPQPGRAVRSCEPSHEGQTIIRLRRHLHHLSKSRPT
ncbi:hypothetical protein VTK73DRAFT_6620 [Phialemonium thermophilum]|uniref:Uncharacterized protein n=1 Tax=Phialemonium thermophilum TaxID=223376 RepID=A0ABR3XV87_9PEZI